MVRAPKEQVWATVAKLDHDLVNEIQAVTGARTGATRTVLAGKTERSETVVELREQERLALEIEDGKASGRLELDLEDHELGTMVIHRARLDVKGLGKGRYKKELRQRVQGLRNVLEA